MRLLVGTSGWSYPAWRGPFYPPGLPPARMLSAYAARLPAVEVNATFHRLPRPELLAGWRAQVPPGFVFALKAPRRITHALRLANAEGALRRLLEAAAELGPGLGPVLFQLPPDLPPDLPRLRDFLDLLPHGAAAFEFRHPGWLGERTFTALAERGAALCVADTAEGTGPRVATAAFGYLRLRRPDYGPADLAAWAGWIAAQPWAAAHVFFKHEDEARGPRFALALAALGGAALPPSSPATP